MPIYSHDIPGIMSMNVSKLFLRNLALNVNHNYNPEKSDITDINVDSMQCLAKNLSTKDIDYSLDKTEVNQIAITTAKVRRLPYPDHNYGQQPPLTPPSDDQRVESTRVKVKDEQEGTTNCICGFDHTDEYMICCDSCGCWEHIVCIGISDVPDKYHCHKCNPREFEIEKAKAIQEAKRKNMSVSDELDEGDESVEENKTHYTAISNTPTRITFLSNTQNKYKTKKASTKVQKRKLSESISSRKKTKRKSEVSDIDVCVPVDKTAFLKYMSDHLKYEHIDSNIYHEDILNASFKWAENCFVDLKNAVESCSLRNIDANQKGLFASCEVTSGSFLVEYKGHLMFFKKFNEENPQLYYWCPFVITYRGVDHLELVIDSRKFGNEARFVRRSCSPNAKFQHLNVNGSLHIVITSITDISKDQEITVPLESNSENEKYFVECCCGSKNCILMKTKEITEKQTDLESPIENDVLVTDIVSKTDSEVAEVDNEQFGDGNEKQLSREEKKIQAVLKQFEKVYKKGAIIKKNKEPKSSLSKNQPSAEETKSSKKISAKRKSTPGGKRRTRQSSCSSEPISPVDQNANCSATSTPNSSWSLTQVQSHFDQGLYLKKDKDTLPFSHVMSHKQKHQLSDSSTPPSTPLMHFSPCKFSEDSSFPLSVDTRSHCDGIPVKPGLSNGLLQIANSRSFPLTPIRSYSQSLGCVTAEEKIGDIDSRSDFCSLSKLNSPILPNKRSMWTNKYYGSLKKHWLSHHDSFSEITQQNENQQNNFLLLASLEGDTDLQNANQCFKRPQSYVPLKRRLLFKSLCKQPPEELLNGVYLDEKLQKTEINQNVNQEKMSISSEENVVCVNNHSIAGEKTFSEKNLENQVALTIASSTFDESNYVNSENNTHEKFSYNNSKNDVDSETLCLETDSVNSAAHSINIENYSLNIENHMSIMESLSTQPSTNNIINSFNSSCSEETPKSIPSEMSKNTAETDLTIALSGSLNGNIDSNFKSFDNELYLPGIIHKTGSSDQGNDILSNSVGNDGLAVGKKKLSYTEYSKRKRTQKLNNLPSDRNPNRSLNGQDSSIKSATYMPIGTEATALFNLQNIPNYISLVSNSSDNSKNTLNHDGMQNDSTQETSEYNSCTSFEPVSSGDDCESPPHETTYGTTIHSDITKNPFSIHSNIIKNANKGNRQSQGHQYTSSPKYLLASYDGSDVDKHYRTHSDLMSERAENVRTHTGLSTSSRGNAGNFQERYKSSHSYPQPNSREYTSRDFREGYLKQSNSLHTYGGNQHTQPSVNRPLHRSSASSPMNNFSIRSPQGSRNSRLSNGGYIPY